MKRSSLSVRLLIAASLSTAIAIAATGAAIAFLFEAFFEERIRSELEVQLTELTAHLTHGADGTIDVTPMPDPRFGQPFSGLYWQVEPEEGSAVLSRSLWDQKISVDRPATAGKPVSAKITHSDGSRLLAVSWRILVGGQQAPESVVLTVASDLEDVTLAAQRFRSNIATWLGLLAVALITAAWLQVRIGLRPLERIRTQIQSVKAEPSRRLPAEFPSEVLPLVEEVNSLLDDQQASLGKARQRAGDLAHGLKTPLTVMRALAKETRDAGNARIAGQIEEQITAMRNFVERELARTRTGMAERTRSGLAEVVTRMVDAMKKLPGGGALDWQVQVPPELTAPFDEHDLSELLGNLLDNARKFATSRVRARARVVDGETVELVIEDDGPGVPADKLEAILERGERIDADKPGHGLGLAIARDLAASHGCALELENADPGGLVVRVRWPVSPPAN
ncbi:MAG: sensor histidine kinase [Paracoccaceae bacterium]